MIKALHIWKGTSLPSVSPEDWDSSSAFLALAEIKRLQGQLASAQALFITLIEPVTGRDTKETLVRELGLSSAEASKAQRAATVVARAPQAATLLASATVSTEHLARLASVDNDDDVIALLTSASVESPDEFARTVDQFRIRKDAKGCGDRARNARTLKFFNTEFGVGFRGVLPAIQGGRFRSLVNEICDANWRKAHPERAEILGGHVDEPRDRRMADALLQITGCGSTTQPATEARGTAHVDKSADDSDGATEPNGTAPATKSADDGEGATEPSGTAPAAKSTNASNGATEVSGTAHPAECADDSDGATEASRNSQPARATNDNDSSIPGSPAATPPTIIARTALVVTINLETLEAGILGRGPIPINDALTLVEDPRTELYAMISSNDGAILRFGRSRRLASPLQKLAMAVRQEGRCAANGCLATYERLDADHDPPFETGGRTNVETMSLYCPRHHSHRHATGAHHTELVGAI